MNQLDDPMVTHAINMQVSRKYKYGVNQSLRSKPRRKQPQTSSPPSIDAKKLADSNISSQLLQSTTQHTINHPPSSVYLTPSLASPSTVRKGSALTIANPSPMSLLPAGPLPRRRSIVDEPQPAEIHDTVEDELQDPTQHSQYQLDHLQVTRKRIKEANVAALYKGLKV